MDAAADADSTKSAAQPAARVPLMTVSAAAREAGVNEETIRRWWDAGEIRGRRSAGGHRLIDPDSLARRLDCVSVIEAAGAAGVSEQTIRGWYDRGLLTGYRTATGQRRIAKASLAQRIATLE